MNHLSFKYILFLLFLHVILVNGQSYLFDIQEITQKDGLPHMVVGDVVQDKKGFIWISTPGEISRYNGKKFKTYDASFLGVNEGNSIYLGVDSLNNIWYCEKKGMVAILDPSKDTIYSISDYTKGLFEIGNFLYFSHSTYNKEEWFAYTTEGTIYKYDGTFKEVFRIPEEVTEHIYCDQGPNGDYWISNFGIIFQVTNQSVIQSFKTLDNFFTIAKFLPNPVFVNRQNKPSYYELKDGQLLPYILPNFPAKALNSIIHFGEEVIYFTANDNQTLLIQDTSKSPIFSYERAGKKNQLSKFIYRGTFIDNQGILWVSTNNGLLKIAQRRNPFTIQERDNSMRGIYIEGEKQWIGGYMKSIFPAAKKVGDNWDEIANIPMTNFCKDEKGHIWASTVAKYLIEYNPKKKELIPHYFNSKADLLVPYYNKKTGRFWIGTNEGLYILDSLSNNLSHFQLPVSSKNLIIRQIYENEKGVWHISNKGLFLMDSQTETILKHYTLSDGLPHENINHVYEDEGGIFWLASKGGGLIKWDIEKNLFQQFKQENGLSNNLLYGIYEDDDEKLWIPSNYGLMSFDKNSFVTKVFLPQNGIAHEEFNTYSHFQAKDGTLYFGGIDGLTIFHPKDLQSKVVNDIPLYITNVRVLDEGEEQFLDRTNEFIRNESLHLSPTYQLLELELSLLDYESFEDIQYAYQIKGHHDQWVYTNENKISIINLPYGDYTLNFKARGASGIWNTKPTRLHLRVKAPFYLQPQFLLLMGLSFFLLIILIIKWREWQLRKEKEKLEDEVRKRTIEIEQSKETILEQAEALKALDKAKTHFFSNITHEFRTPLTLVIGPLQQMISAKSTLSRQPLKGVLKNAKIILNLINQLLDISKLEAGKMKIEVSHGNIISHTKKLMDSFNPITHEKKQRLIFMARPKYWEVSFDKNKWDKIIFNLLSNALKFTPEGGCIQLNLSKIHKSNNEWVYLRISDTGIGIQKTKIKHIFNRFFQINDSSTRHYNGTGIGLALVKELIELQGGEIWVHSIVNKGTTFEIQLPLLNARKNNLDEIPVQNTEAFLLPMAYSSFKEQKKITTIEKKHQKLKLLLIEDNLEMQQYVYSCIDSERFKVIMANNGLEGIQKAQNLIPDLIISDIMMPLKNGYEVVDTVRKDITTSHIPIILLTAKTALKSRLKGIELGADAYLSKPFSPEELKLRIQKLIEIRQFLQSRYSNHKINSPLFKTEANAFQKEDLFITKIKRYVIKHINDPSLNGDIVGQHLKLSRMQLHRKLKALTNQSTSQFIQSIRFDIAIDLLQKKQLNISEISYRVGFSSPGHFTRAFKQKYGKTPSSFIKTKKE